MQARRVVPALAALLSLALVAHAEGRRGEGGTQWSVGVAVIGSPRPYVDADNEIIPVPLFAVRAHRFFFETVRMGVRAVDTRHFDMDVLAQARFDGYEASDSDFLVGMSERRMSADAGIRMLGSWEHVETTFMALTDVLGRHDGQQVSLMFGFPVRADGWKITPALGIEWQSASLVDYYYGVTPAEAMAKRPAYEGEDAVNPRVELSLHKPFARRKWTFFGTLTHEWLGSEIKDSPIVEDSTTVSGHVGILRTW